jgi:hypothetical protein
VDVGLLLASRRLEIAFGVQVAVGQRVDAHEHRILVARAVLDPGRFEMLEDAALESLQALHIETGLISSGASGSKLCRVSTVKGPAMRSFFRSSGVVEQRHLFRRFVVGQRAEVIRCTFL